MTPVKGFHLKSIQSKKLRWGVAGCGKFTENTFLPNLALLKKNSLVSVYSATPERAKAIKTKFFADYAFSDYDEFLNSDFDVLYIGSANHNHYEQVIKAAKKGKHILCDKPLAVNSQQAAEMNEVCRQNGVILTVNYVYRYHPLAVKAKEFLDKGMFGKLISISSNFNINYPPNDNFRYTKELSGGGALWDLGSHLIDLMMYFGGEIEDVKGFADNIIYKSEVEDYAGAMLKFKKSGYGYITCSFCAERSFNSIEITGHKGSMRIDNFIGKKTGYSRLTINLEKEVMKSFRRRAPKQLHLLKSVQKALLNNTLPKVSGEEAVENIKILEKISNKWT